MNKSIIKGCVLSCVFSLAVILFGYLMNHTNEDMTSEMKAASLPVMELYYKNQQISKLFGYVNEMDGAFMRDGITLVDDSKKIPMKLRTYGYAVDGISYEIRSLDTTRLLVNSDITEYKNEQGIISTEIKVQNLLDEGEEYLLIVKLTSNEQEISYYTRLLEAVDCNVDEGIEFVREFHATTFQKDAAANLATYVEPNETGDNTTLQHVDIHSSLDQITWGGFNVQPLSTATLKVPEITTSYQVYLLNYVVTAKGENGEMEYYNVEEYYRLRFSERIYLLDYERDMNRIFRWESKEITDNKIMLGIRNGDVSYKTNEIGNILCFVQEGELWSVHADEGKLSRVFSFRGYEGIDDRENHEEYSIEILKLDETGNIDFSVIGYMNRGDHEGEVGIGLYHYNAEENTVEETMFLPVNMSYEVLKTQTGQLMYANEEEELFLGLANVLYGIDISSTTYSEIKTDLTSENYAVSDSKRFAAWVNDGGKEYGRKILLYDFETENSFEIDAPTGAYIRPLGFMEEDFIYGLIRETDLTLSSAGNMVPMYQVCIMDSRSENHDILKKYEKAGYFVSDIDIYDYTIYLNRILYNGVTFVDADQDTIMNRDAELAAKVEVGQIVTEKKQTEHQLVMNEMKSIGISRLMTPKEVVKDSSVELELPSVLLDNCYFAYARAKVLMVTDELAEAITTANEEMGVVLDDSQQYVWKRAKKSLVKASSVADIAITLEGSNLAKSLKLLLTLEDVSTEVQGMLNSGKSVEQILQDALPDCSVYNLTGCELEEMLYYISNGTKVLAITGANDAKVILGYDATTVTVYDPGRGSAHRVDLEEACEELSSVGNTFYVYRKNE